MKIFLTGASSGIGMALARVYAASEPRASLTLGLFARRLELLEKAGEEISAEHGQTVASFGGDVRVAADLQRAGADFIARFGPPDIVIANAGVSRGTLTEYAEDLPAFAAVFETNVMGIVHTFQPFLAAMRARGSGTLVGIASVAGFRGLPGSGAYSASKAAAISYLESLRVEEQRNGVRVVTLCPGYIATPLTAKNPYAMPFLMQPDDAAARMRRVIAAGSKFAVVPWQMAIVGRVLRCLPRGLYDRAFANVKRKPRIP
ncbi:MAG: SDR family oxidoreductase [Betaproteobacteria bacterium]